MDPLGNEPKVSACTICLTEGVVSYTWSYEGKEHVGRITVSAGGAEFTDSWHQTTPQECSAVPSSQALLDVQYSYSAGEGPEWGWRIILSHRTPTGELVLQMTNVCPWGERNRAVRMICIKA